MINQRAKRAMFHRCKTTGGYGPRFFHASIPLDSGDFPNHGLKPTAILNYQRVRL